MAIGSRRAGRSLLALALALGTAGCEDDFPLGSWGQTSQPTEQPPPAHVSPACGDVGTVGDFNKAGPMLGTTNVYESWYWPAPMDSLEWDLVIENAPEEGGDGYYWAHQFSWVGGLVGYFGLQANGGYQEDPTPTATMPNGSAVDFVKMALFWVAGPPLGGELGDITGIKNARVAPVPEPGATFLTINARYDWTVCHVYHLRLAKYSTEDDGSVWWGAWITDQTTSELTLLGRILVPSTWGELQTLTSTYTTRIDAVPGHPVTTCSDPEPASGIFGTPSANDGQMAPIDKVPSFASPTRCPTSRFTDLATGVRQELGVRPVAPAP